jgi:hypothetical protein
LTEEAALGMLGPMSRSRGAEPPREHVAARLDQATVERLDRLLPLYALPGRPATRTDVVRAVILAGLDVEESRAAEQGIVTPSTRGA